jgi:non-heme Fe2+,alpha-ketoglutarate-dependent halogenase
MSTEGAANLSRVEQLFYQREGYFFPIRVFNEVETAEFRSNFLKYLLENQGGISGRPARQHNIILTETHTILRWVYRIVSDPRVLDAVESVLGPDLLIWSSAWFPKMPGDQKYISWHQDATYWGLHPPNVATGWIALTESTPENGCLRVVPGTHEGPLLAQVETYAWNNALSRGQEIAVAVDESKAVEMVLRPGEMSLHHIGLVHGSKTNGSDKPRIGIAVRYITPAVMQEHAVRQHALLVRGEDAFGHFELIDPPEDDNVSAEDAALRAEIMERKRTKSLSESSWKGGGSKSPIL